jgi:hypothetical protein
MTVIFRARAVLNGWSGGPGLNTFYFRPGTVGGSVSDATDVLARVRAFWNAISAQLPAALTIATAPTVDALEDTTGVLVGSYASSAPPTAVTGTGVTEFYAPQVMCLLQMNTTAFVAGRRVQGRSFIGPVTEGAIAAGSVSTATISAITGAALLQLTPSSPPTPSFPVVWRRPRPGVPGGSYSVTAFSMPTKTATLKSRRDG